MSGTASSIGGISSYDTQPTPQWRRYEAKFTSSSEYENPVQDVEVEVEFASPRGQRKTVLAFWDGGHVWKARFSPFEVGRWTYQTRCSSPADSGLHNKRGGFVCAPYAGENPLYLHGAIRVADTGHYFVHADGTPFFWVGDTAWLGALKSTASDWEMYLNDRESKDFSVVHIFTTQARHVSGDADERLAYLGKEKIAIDPVFFQRMDERMNAVNDHGLAVAPILLHDSIVVPPREKPQPGWFLPVLLREDQLIVLARYMVARYGAHHVLWTLGGDGDYSGQKSEEWRRIGQAVFKYSVDRLATMHPGGQLWDAGEFQHEPWFSFVSYQSGHGDSPRELRWLTEGPASKDWRVNSPRPEINNELNYEGFIPYGSKSYVPFGPHEVRRACYWSLLVTPPAGVTYGSQLWAWGLKPELAMQGEDWGVVPPWHEAMNLMGSRNMKRLKEFFTSVEYWKLLPEPELIAEQPGREVPERFIAAAKTAAGDLAVVYIPEGAKVSIRMSLMKSPVNAEWFDPVTGWRSSAGQVMNQGIHRFEIHGLWDSVLILKSSVK